MQGQHVLAFVHPSAITMPLLLGLKVRSNDIDPCVQNDRGRVAVL